MNWKAPERCLLHRTASSVSLSQWLKNHLWKIFCCCPVERGDYKPGKPPLLLLVQCREAAIKTTSKKHHLASVLKIKLSYEFHMLPLSSMLPVPSTHTTRTEEKGKCTKPGRTGASHMCLPSVVSFTLSISLSGVRMSPDTSSKMLTLSGKAAISEKKL